MPKKRKAFPVDGSIDRLYAINGNSQEDDPTEEPLICANRKDQNPVIARKKQKAKYRAGQSAALYIHYVLKSTGWTQVYLAKRLGVTPSRIGNIYRMSIGKNGSMPGINLSFLEEIEMETGVPYLRGIDYPPINKQAQ